MLNMYINILYILIFYLISQNINVITVSGKQLFECKIVNSFTNIVLLYC